MKIGTFSALFGGVLLVVLWGAGVNEVDILIIAFLVISNMAFQVYSRGNVSWMGKPNYEKISKKIPIWAYTFISTLGLLSIVFVITKATSSI